MKYPMEERRIWFKGKLIPIREANVMAFSPTAQFGLNVFEGIPCYWNAERKEMYAFRLDDHYNRLIKSARLLQIGCDYTKEQMEKALTDVVKANEFEESINIRQTLFVDGFGSWYSEGKTEMFVVPTPRGFNNPEYNKNGLKVCVTSWRRISDNTISPRVKCGANYINSRVGQREALRNGYDTCIFLNENGKVAESTGSCVFIIKNKKLITPSLTESVLESITRDSVMIIAEYLGIIVEERAIDRTELYCADEVFLCGSAMEIRPVFSVDGYKISDDVGDITKAILDIYHQIVVHNNLTFDNWIELIYTR